MSTLRYPADLDTMRNDFIKFEHFAYKLNQEMKGIGVSPPKEAGSKSIVLYMPNTTPAAHNTHDSRLQTFPGPLGEVVKGGLKMMGTSFKEMSDNATSQEFYANIARNWKSIAETGAGAAQQFALDYLARQLGYDAATAVALGQGKVFNPNAEMIYNQPLHRKFNFRFDFVPKSEDDTRAVDEIIYEFKRWSAPEIEEGDRMMKIPHLWKISYHQAEGSTFKRMNLFKPAMMVSFVAQDNPNSDFHMTIQDGSGHVPVQTSISMFFEETMPLNHRDHETALGMGHYRGF